MKKTYEKIVVKEVAEKYGQNEKFIILLEKICEDNNIKNSKNIIENFLKGVSKGVSQ